MHGNRFLHGIVVAEQDQIIPPDAQCIMAQRMGANILSIAASHVAMISHPGEVVKLIMDSKDSKS